MGESGHVLTVKITETFSKLGILAQVKVDVNHCYILENNVKVSGLLVARAVVVPGKVRLCQYIC